MVTIETGRLFSVIVPTLNEAGYIGHCISSIVAADPSVEVIVTDGGSSDDTAAIAKSMGAAVIQTEPCRGLQCNCGAAIASGEILVFLHADTILPENAFARLKEFFSQDEVKLANFKVTFNDKHWFLRLLASFSSYDHRIFRFGDQGIVVRKTLFNNLGGFPDWSLFEDLAFILRARKQTSIDRLPIPITISARRFLRNGVVRQQLKNIYYIAQYMLGVSPEKLARKYYRTEIESNLTSIVILTRLPELGRVKTRLARTIGPEKATKFYRECTEHILKEATKLPPGTTKYVYYTPKSSKEDMQCWAGPWFHYRPQPEGDLGKRLKVIFNEQFRTGVKKVIVAATDVPDISVNDLEEAVKSLDEADLVLGPSVDGGYYLIGMNKFYPGLFDGISWSTNVVYEQTLRKANELGLRTACLQILDDIDNEEDLDRWQKRRDLAKIGHLKCNNTNSG